MYIHNDLDNDSTSWPPLHGQNEENHTSNENVERVPLNKTSGNTSINSSSIDLAKDVNKATTPISSPSTSPPVFPDRGKNL